MLTDPAPPGPAAVAVTVTGGASELVADYDDLVALAGRLDHLADTLDGLLAAASQAAVAAAHQVADPGAAAVLRTVRLTHCARLATSADRARDEARGLAAALFAAPARYGAAESALTRATAELRTVAAGVFAAGRAATLAAGEVVTGHPLTAAQVLLTGDPALVDAAAWLTGATALLQVAGLLPEAGPQVVDLGTAGGDAAPAAPRSLVDLVTGLALRDEGHHGEIGVSTLVGADGRRRAIVDITGTKSWNPLPNRDATSLTTDLRAMSGAATSYERGVLQAMARAGVRPGEPVLLVGHSEGGIVAIDAARHADPRRFRITAVVTAGSPIGAVVTGLPRAVQVLALENSSDVVPHLDGRANPRAADLTTVVVDEHRTGIGASHHLADSYGPVAAQADLSAAPSVTGFLRDRGAFLAGRRIRTRVFWIRRR